MHPAYQEFNGKVCVSATELIDSGIATIQLWKKWSMQAKQLQYVTRTGGNGRSSLIELIAIPTRYREQIIERFGSPEKQFNALEEFFRMDGEARAFYLNYRYPQNGKALEPHQVTRYTVNASMLNAIYDLREARIKMTKRLGNVRRDLKDGLTADSIAFNAILKTKFDGIQHTLPKHPRKLMDKLALYKRQGYASIIDGRANNTNAQVVTPEMIALWNAIFAGQRHKPTHFEVSAKYQLFLTGKLEIVNKETGELFVHTEECFKPVSEASIYNYLAEWSNRVGVFKARSGNRKTYMDRHTPSGRMLRPTPGAIISVDDYQPPFKWGDGEGKRMWFYAAQDLGSTAITSWVYGDSKEGIITDFYRQLIRTYTALGICLPYEIECEASLNSSFADTFLANGAMFTKTRIIPNKPRTKRIERTIRDLRLQKASKHPAFIARPHARDENYQQHNVKPIYLTKREIIDEELRIIEEWNNELHPDQDVYPGMTRWDVFMDKQHSGLKPTNWAGILPHLGYYTETSMRLGRITLQGIDRVVGINGQVALGDTLINIMNEIEGCDVDVFWMDDEDGNVIKALVYNKSGRMICELMDDLPFHRSEIDQTERCKQNMQLYFAYEKTVDAHANRVAKSVDKVVLIESADTTKKRFVIPGLKRYEAQTEIETNILPPVNDDTVPPVQDTVRRSLLDRF